MQLAAALSPFSGGDLFKPQLQLRGMLISSVIYRRNWPVTLNEIQFRIYGFMNFNSGQSSARSVAEASRVNFSFNRSS